MCSEHRIIWMNYINNNKLYGSQKVLSFRVFKKIPRKCFKLFLYIGINTVSISQSMPKFNILEANLMSTNFLEIWSNSYVSWCMQADLFLCSLAAWKNGDWKSSSMPTPYEGYIRRGLSRKQPLGLCSSSCNCTNMPCSCAHSCSCLSS